MMDENNVHEVSNHLVSRRENFRIQASLNLHLENFFIKFSSDCRREPHFSTVENNTVVL